jgi:uncharacterized protein (TIGR00251 family)
MAVARVAVRLYARAGRDEIRGVRDGVLLARVAAPPVDGKANRALCRLLAREVGVRPSDVSVVLGATSPDKLVQVEGISEHMVRAAIDRARGRKAG